MRIKLTILTVIIMLVSFPVSAQRSRYIVPSMDKMSKKVVGTFNADSRGSKQVVLLANGTWTYSEPGLKARLDTNEFISAHWDTTQLFCWKDVEIKDLPQTIDLHVIDSLYEYHFPTTGKVFSKYGMRGRHVHNGVDISPLPVGEPLFATFEGKVRYAKYNSGGYGYLVILRHPNGLETWYAHLSRINCHVEDYVSAGQIIGYSGNTGRSRGPHLHYEIRYKDQTFDPEFLIDFETGNLKFQNFLLERKFFNIHSRASELLVEDGFEEAPEKELANMDNPTIEDNPTIVEEENEPKYHIVKSGDTLSAIAKKYHTTVDKLCKDNKISKTSTLRLKQRIRVQ